MPRPAPKPSALAASAILTWSAAIACGSDDGGSPADTDASTGPTTSSPTTNADDAPALDSTGGGPGTVGPDTDTDPSGMTEGATDGSGTATDDGPMGCSGDDDCTDADAPFCVDTLCAPCTATADPDAACAEKFPETPACVTSTCVQCSAEVTDACTGNTPLCDTTTNTCIACTSHDECPGGAACHIAEDDSQVGECFPADAVFYVDGDAPGCDDAGPGTMATPWCTLQSHVDALAASEAATFYVGELGGGADYPTLDVTGGRDVALLAMDGQRPTFQGGAGSSLSISGGNTDVYLEGLRFEGNTVAVAVTVSDAVLFVQRCEIVQNQQGNFLAENGASLHLESSFVGDNTNAVTAVQVNSASANIVYSTIAVDDADFEDVYAVACATPQEVTIRNSLVFSADNPASKIFCSGAEVTYTGSVQLIPGTGNVALEPVGAMWFANFNTGDFHLNAPPAAIATTAQWQTGDPLTDIDGNPRNAIDGGMDHAGADVP